jgi:hypothetical protein
MDRLNHAVFGSKKIKFRVPSWFPVSSFRFPVSGFWFLVSGFWKKPFLQWGGPPCPPASAPGNNFGPFFRLSAHGSRTTFSWFAGDRQVMAITQKIKFRVPRWFPVSSFRFLEKIRLRGAGCAARPPLPKAVTRFV